MFLDKFRNRYSYNFLSFCGYVIFLLLIKVLTSKFYATYIIDNTETFLPFAIIITGFIILDLISIFIVLIIFVFEKKFNFKIQNENILNKKPIKIIQQLGIIFVFLPIVYMILVKIYYLLVI